MATTTISTKSSATFSLEAGNELIVTSTGEIEGAANGVVAAGSGTKVTIAGYVHSTAADVNSCGVYLQSTSTLELTADGRVHGFGYGVQLGTSATVINAGTITSDREGLRADSRLNLTNSGTIEGDIIGVNYAGFDTSQITNSGTISGGTSAIQGSGHGDVVINNGHLEGLNAVFLQSGTDFYDGRNGTATGTIDLGAANDTAYGGAHSETFFGAQGDDYIDGGGDSDTAIYTGSGPITVDLNLTTAQNTGQGLDTLISIENIWSGNGSDVLIGSADDNTITGNLGNDTLEGGLGNDRLDGSGDTDTARYRGAAGAIVDLSVAAQQDTGGYGLDTLLGIENLDGGVGADRFTGSAVANALLGNAGNDTLEGGLGDDTLDGGSDNDTARYHGSAAATVDLSIAGQQATGGYGLDVLLNIENLEGGSGGDKLTGNGVANWLNGGAGADTLTGGAGADAYTVDNIGDVVVETSASDGDDTVFTSVDFTLPAFFEGLLATGSGAIALTGNALGNSLSGNVAANVLDGGLGADFMAGGAGDDTYLVDNAGDVVLESFASGGTDTVKSSTDYTLGNNIENLVASGAGAIRLTGNASGNVMTGNAAGNVIDGGAGADTMSGRAGNDTYVIDDANDIVVETQVSDGIDTVLASVDFRLSDFVDNLVATGSAAVRLSGNASTNAITGNGAANFIAGGAGADQLSAEDGDDRLRGGDGNDILQGGSGRDIFMFDTKLNKRTNKDKITDFVVKDDTIWLDNAIFKKLGKKGSESKPGPLSKKFFVVGEKAKESDDYLVFNKRKGLLYYDVDGSGVKAAVEIASLKKNLKLTVSDFFVV